MAYRETTATPNSTKTDGNTREERRKMEFASRAHSTSGQVVKISYVIVMIMMLSIPLSTLLTQIG